MNRAVVSGTMRYPSTRPYSKTVEDLEPPETSSHESRSAFRRSGGGMARSVWMPCITGCLPLHHSVISSGRLCLRGLRPRGCTGHRRWMNVVGRKRSNEHSLCSVLLLFATCVAPRTYGTARGWPAMRGSTDNRSIKRLAAACSGRRRKQVSASRIASARAPVSASKRARLNRQSTRL